MHHSADGLSRAASSRSAKGRKRASSILDAAVAVLAEDGHAALSLRRVADRADVKLGHLQYYFPSRQALLHATVERTLEDLAARTERAAAGNESGPDALAALVSSLLTDQANGARVRLLAELRVLAVRSPEIAALLSAYTNRLWRAIAAAFTAASADLSRAKVERRAAILVALLEGLMVFRPPDRPGELPLLGLEREIIELTRRLCDT